jgi:hypothetical protein
MYTGLQITAIRIEAEMNAPVLTARGAVGNKSGALAYHTAITSLADLRR